MKALLTTEATNQYLQKLRAGNCYTHTKVTYIDDAGAEIIFRDHQYPMKIEKKAEPPRYANINHDPAASEVSFGVINLGGEYSNKNVGSAKSGILVKNRVFKFYAGANLRQEVAAQTISFSNASASLWFMKVSGGLIVPDMANLGASSGVYCRDLFNFYGQGNYGSFNYSPSGYALFEKDFRDTIYRSGRYNIEKFTIVANSAHGRVYYRTGTSLADIQALSPLSTAWEFAGLTANGSKDFTINALNAGAIQIIVINGSPTWDASDFTITSNVITYRENVEWVLLGTFYLDDPKFDENIGAQLSEVKVSGRGAWKKALETEINIRDLTAGVSLTALIKEIADRIGLSYTVTSIADLSAYSSRTLDLGYEQMVKASVIFRDIMVIIGTSYNMSVDDSNVLYVTARPTNALAEFVLNYRRYVKAKQNPRSDKQVQRITIFTDKQIVNAETTLGAAQTYTTSGAQSAHTWLGAAIGKYYKVTSQSGTMAIVSVAFTNTSATVTTSGAGSITIQFYGNKFKSTAPRFVGEAISAANVEANVGTCFQITLPLALSDAECKTIAEALVASYGDPDYGIEIEEAYLNPFAEIRDPALVISRDFLEKAVYETVGIRHDMKSETDKSTTLTLVDTGVNIDQDGDIVYDRNKAPISGLAIQYDKGFVYDLRLGPNASIFDVDPAFYKHDVGYL